MSDEFWFLDLVALSRRRVLTREERAALDSEVETHATLRVLAQTSRDFADLAEVRSGDELLLDRSVKWALSERRRRPARRAQPRRWTPFVSALAAVLFGASTTFGFWGIYWAFPRARPERPRVAAEPSIRVGHRSTRAGELIRAKSLVEDAQTSVDTEQASFDDRDQPNTTHDGDSSSRIVQSTDHAKGVAMSPSASPTRNAKSRVGETTNVGTREQPFDDGAAALFSRATAARRAGRVAEAVGAFRELQDRYGSSVEAANSHLPLGRLLLEQGDASEALTQFGLVQGALEEEGLVGQAQAQAALGRHEESRAVLTRLRERFPHSVYVREPHERLNVKARGYR